MLNRSPFVQIAAGSFSEWLRATEASLESAKDGAAVPCGACTACCRSSMFILIKPEEKETLRRIAPALLFSAPGLPKGHLVLGYDNRGHCPMLVEDRCSIYEHRPQTCRDYDCRVFAATGISADRETQPDIAERATAWQFHYENETGRAEHSNLQRAAAFLQNNRNLFPPRSLPSHPAQLATFAIRIYKRYTRLAAQHSGDAPAIARAIATSLRRMGVAPRFRTGESRKRTPAPCADS